MDFETKQFNDASPTSIGAGLQSVTMEDSKLNSSENTGSVDGELFSFADWEESGLNSLKNNKDWLAVAQTSSGEQRIFDKKQFIPALRAGILDGLFTAGSAVDVHVKAQDGTWNKTTSSLAQFAKGHFHLRVLYEPVWSHAMAGLKWGALVGIGLKLLDTLILLGSVDPSMAVLFLVAIGVCFIPRIGMAGVAMVSFMMFKYSKANFFMIGLSAALIGATLGCIPGMAIGGAVGFSRKKELPQAPDAEPEPDGLMLKAVVFPFLGGVALWSFYLFIFNPWLLSILEK